MSKFTHATTAGPPCGNCQPIGDVEPLNMYRYRRVSPSVWEARCEHCGDTAGFYCQQDDMFSGCDTTAVALRKDHWAFALEPGPDETAHYRAAVTPGGKS
jgi:hypothetical protein